MLQSITKSLHSTRSFSGNGNSLTQKPQISSRAFNRNRCSTTQHDFWSLFHDNHRPTWAEINLDNVANNVKAFRSKIPPSANLIAVVKADAYGHGAEMVGKVSLENGANRLAVAVVEEGISLRQSGLIPPSTKIHVLGLSAPGTEESLLRWNLIPTIADFSSVERFASAAERLGIKRPFPFHFKVDTGMGRIGCLKQDIDHFVTQFQSMSPGKAQLEGVFTHFSKADETDKKYSKKQVKNFSECLDKLKKNGIEVPYIHTSNSAGIIDSHLIHDSKSDPHHFFISDNLELNTFRLGISLYGFYPSSEIDHQGIPFPLKPVMSLKTRIVQLKELEPGHGISYGAEYVTHKPKTKVATLPIGYADGYRRLLGNKHFGNHGSEHATFNVLVRGQYAPIIGRVCMDMCHIDVTEIEGVSAGDEVVLIGEQGRHSITVDQMASKLKTINYEVTCLVGKRVPRLYTQGGKYVGIKSVLFQEASL